MSLKLPRNWDFNLKTDAAKIARSRSVMSAVPAVPPLQLGWLRRQQRSLVRPWQLRFFVLRGQQLLCYRDPAEDKPQGCLELQGSTVNVVATGPEEGGKFIFEIIPGPAGQEPCVLMAGSQAEMEQWVQSIRRARGGPAAVFGQHLADTMAQEQRFGQHQVPVLVQESAEFIRQHGLAEEGIFRLPGQDNLVRQLRDAFDAGERPSFHRDTDVHTVASLFKLYLRELPEPVVPWLQYEDFLLCGKALEADETKGHQELLKQLSLLPRDNYNLLSYICRFLYEIQLNSSVNKMSVENLATVIGVNLIRPRVEDPAVIMRGTPQVQKVMTVMISEHEKLFPPAKDVPPSPPAQKTEKKAPVPRSSVGWEAAEDPTHRHMGDPPSSSSTPGPAATSSVPGEATETEDTLGMWKTQPRKRTQTLPTRKSSLAAVGEKGSKEGDQVLGSDFWKGSRPTASDGHKRTLSHDLFKLLDLYRASASESAPPCQAEGGEGSSPSPASSISEREFLPCLSPSHEPEEPGSPSSPAEEPRPEQESREFLQSMVLRLEKEMEAQRIDYEGQIQSLQKENYEVWAKVVRLNQELEQEKKKCGELELRLVDTERLREGLENKAKMLEEEIKNLNKSMSETGAKTN